MDIIGLLDKYLIGKIDERELYSDIRQKFSEFISKYKFRELEYLRIYPFLSELQDEDLYEKVRLKEKIKEIKGILGGQESFSYDLWMNLMPNDMKVVNNIWSNYKIQGRISLEEVELLQNMKRDIMRDAKTVEGVCWEKLLALLFELPVADDDFGTYNLLYAKEIDMGSICDEVERLIDILQGKKAIHILLKYTCTDFICIIM